MMACESSGCAHVLKGDDVGKLSGAEDLETVVVHHDADVVA